MTTLGLVLLLAASSPEPVDPTADGPAGLPETDAPIEPEAAPSEPEAAPSEPAAPTPTVEEPGSGTGGFGSVSSVSTDSDVVAPAPSTDDEWEDGDGEDEGPRWEIGMRVEIGYGQFELGNPGTLDHQGAALRAELGFYPWLSKRRRIGVGVGLTYAYQGFNRRDLPEATELSRSRGRQQLIGLRVPLLFRLHPEWFALEPSGLIGGAFFSADDDVFVGGRRAIIPEDAAAFATGGDLAMCTLWEILCVVGGAEYLIGLETLSADDTNTSPMRLRPWSWHVGLGVDVFRALSRGNRLPS